jgi:hypothetical protein
MLTRTLAAAAILATLAFSASAMADENGTVGGAVAGAGRGGRWRPGGLCRRGSRRRRRRKRRDQPSPLLSPLRRQTPSVLPRQRRIGAVIRASQRPFSRRRPSKGRQALLGRGTEEAHRRAFSGWAAPRGARLKRRPGDNQALSRSAFGVAHSERSWPFLPCFLLGRLWSPQQNLLSPNRRSISGDFDVEQNR